MTQAKSWSAEAQMTSSFRATGQASVRSTPASVSSVPAGAWALSELKVPVGAALPSKIAPPAQPPITAALVAEERARAIDEGYARGLVDGERKGKAAAQAQVSEAITVLDDAVAQLHEVATLAPAILEENIAALAVVVARQIVAREVGLDSALVADLVRRA